MKKSDAREAQELRLTLDPAARRPTSAGSPIT